MGKLRLLAMAAAVVLTLAFSGSAFAAAIVCGDCHGNPPVNSDNCGNTARGLHGTHVNYSSVTFPKTVASYGKCAYCHPSTVATAPTVTHVNGFINVTGAAGTKAPGLRYSATTCTNACHKNRAQTAPWGIYTSSVAIVLNCRSCHDDVIDKTGLSGSHAKHLNTTISTGGTAMGAALNAGCVNCHPNQVNDIWSGGKADNGTKKAYPHAQDGTNVVSDNAAVLVNISSTRAAGSADTCAKACHKNTKTATWGGALACDACHYYNAAPNKASNDAAIVKLSDAHSAHFAAGATCDSCHVTVTTVANHFQNTSTAGVKALPTVAGNAWVRKALGYSGGAAGTCSTTGSGCHGVGNTTPAWNITPGTYGCANCHSYPTVAGRDWTGTNGHVVKYDAPVVNTHLKASGFNKNLDTYSSMTRASNGKCYTCHKSVNDTVHKNGSINVTPVGNNICGVGNFSASGTSGSSITCSNVSCHSGKVTPNWW